MIVRRSGRQTEASRHIPREKAQKVREKLQIFLYLKSSEGGDVTTEIY